MHTDLVQVTENDHEVSDEDNGNVYGNVEYTYVQDETEEEDEDEAEETVQHGTENSDINQENDENKDEDILESVPDSNTTCARQVIQGQYGVDQYRNPKLLQISRI